MEGNVISAYSESEFYIKLYLEEYLEKSMCVISHKKLKGFKECIKKYRDRKFTFLIEIQKSHWIVLHVTEGANDPAEKYSTAHYIDPIGKKVPAYIKKILNSFQIQHEIFKLPKSYDLRTNWVSSLYAARELGTNPFSSFSEAANHFSNDEIAMEFFKEISDAKLQFQKVKDKIKVCLQLFNSACKEKFLQSKDYKMALLILQYVEALALEDNAISNLKIKQYIKNIIGNENINVIKEIRYWLLHRDTRYYEITPNCIKQYVFKNVGSDSAELLEGYLNNLLSILQGQSSNQVIQPSILQEQSSNQVIQPTDIFSIPPAIIEDNIPTADIKNKLNSYIFEFIKEGFSIYKTEYIEKVMLNFLINFLPLLKTFYGKRIEVFQDLFDYRNELIHNVYILYQTNRGLPYIAFQNILQELKEYMLRLYFSNKFSQTLQNEDFIKICKENIYEASLRMENCFQSLADEFKEKLFPAKLLSEIKCHKKIHENRILDFIDLYLRTLPIIDKSNEISITNIKIKNFALPTMYYRFTNDQRELIFNQFLHLINIYTSNTSADIIIPPEIESSLKILGVSEEEINLICNSITNSKYLSCEELVASILIHITFIKDMLRSGLSLKVVLDDYKNYLNGDSCLNKKCYKFILLAKFKNKHFEFKFLEESFYMDLFTIAQNIIPVFFDISNENILFKNLDQVLSDDNILKFLSNEFVDKSRQLTMQIFSLDVFVPLGIKLFFDGKLIFNDKNEENDFIRYCITVLLKSSFKNEYLQNLLNLRTKDKLFNTYSECFEIVTNKKFIIPQIKITFLLSLENFQKKIIDTVKSAESLAKDSAQERLALQLMKYKYLSVEEKYLRKEYEDALCLVDNKATGLSRILKELQLKNIIVNSLTVVKIKFLIAKVKLKFGVEIRKKRVKETVENLNRNPDKDFNGVIKISESILSTLPTLDNIAKKKLRLSLSVKAIIAYTQSLLANHGESLKLYEELHGELFSMIITVPNELVNTFENYRSLVKSKDYRATIKVNPELNILKILNKINFERYNLGKTSQVQETKNDNFMTALKGFQKAHLIQRKILGINKKITINSLLKIGELTLRLKGIAHFKLYEKSLALFKQTEKTNIYKNKLKIRRLRTQIESTFPDL